MRTGQPIRPVVIAHRGASGYLPEHTLPAKTLAFEMEADYLEQDIVATADDELVVLHDIHLDRVTDVAAVFPERCRSDGRYYVRDFMLDEIRRLAVHERTNADGTAVYPGRHKGDDVRYRIHTFAEELLFIAELQSGDARPVGIYPEIKRPAWHRQQGIDLTPLILDTLSEFGYDEYTDPVYLQCFDDKELVRIRGTLGSELKLVQLIGDNDWGEAETDYDELLSDGGLTRLAAIVDGIGPWINHLFRFDGNGKLQVSDRVSKAHDLGLAVHPFTFRRDDLPSGFETFEELIRFAIDELCIDGLFTDFPDVAKRAING